MDASTTVSTSISYRYAYRAALEGKGGTLREFYAREPTSPVNVSGDTVLHVLALNCHSDTFCELMDLSLPDYGLLVMNYKGNTALHEAARTGCVEIAIAMIRKEPNLVSARNQLGETPLYWAALFGQKKMLHFLANTNGGMNELRRYDGCTILHAAVMGQFYGLALEIMVLYPDLAYARNGRGTTALHILAQTPSSFRSGTAYTHLNLGYFPMIPLQMFAIVIYLCIPVIACARMSEDSNRGLGSCQMLQILRGMIRRLIQRFPWLRDIDYTKQKHNCAVKLAKHLIGKMMNWNYNINDGGNPSRTWTSSPLTNLISENRIEDPLLMAAKLGIVEIVEAIIHEFPDAMELVDKNGKNILHLALEHRKVGLFELLKSNKFPIARMAGEVDKDGNTPLHAAAKLGDHRPRHVRGARELMSWEFFWFKSVKQVSPPHLIPLKNYVGQTAEELFDNSHKNMLRDAENQTKGMMNVSMLISTLLAAMSFMAVITVPGGFATDTGLPVLFKKKDFSKFIIYASLAFCFCLLNLGLSVTIQLSRFRKEDFYISLPFKYLINTNFLFYSVVYILTAYSQAFILDTNTEIPRVQYGIALAATVGVCGFMILLYIDIMYTVVHYFLDVLSISYHVKNSVA